MDALHVNTEDAAFGQEVRRLRTRGPHPISQRKLAAALGYDPSFVSRIETGRVRAPKDFLDRLDRVEGLDLSTQDRERLLQLSVSPGVIREWNELRGRDPFGRFLSAAGPHVRKEARVDRQEKRVLAAYLAGRLERLGAFRSMPLILDSGSLAGFLCEELVALFHAGIQWEVYTGNLLAAVLLSGSMPLHLLGGRVNSQFGSTLSAEASESLGRLIDRLCAASHEAPAETAIPLGVLSCAAFSAHDGPWSRLHEPSTDRHPSGQQSEHFHWKQTMIDRIPWLLVPLNPEKFARVGDPLWADLGPIESNATNHWRERLRKADDLGGPMTHIVIAFPASSDDPFYRRRKILAEIRALLDAGDAPPFAITTDLRSPQSGERGANLLTVLDAASGKPFPQETLEEILDSHDDSG